MLTQEILLVEDSEGDILLTRQAMALAMKRKVALTVARDGQEALDLLRKRVEEKQTLPQLILLDLNLPRLKGLHLLKTLREESSTQFLPIIILSNSSNEKEIRRCYELGANSYLIKPIDFDEFVEMLRKLDLFWFNANMLPGKEG
jgi:CheY-like chemotaxis protein